MDDLKKELPSLRLDDEPPRSRVGRQVTILFVFFVASGTTV